MLIDFSTKWRTSVLRKVASLMLLQYNTELNEFYFIQAAMVYDIDATVAAIVFIWFNLPGTCLSILT